MYKFDSSLDAKSVKKERFVWLVFMGIVFFLLYGSSNQYAHLTSPHPSLFMEFEREIPFIEYFIVPYMSSDLMFVIAFLLPYTRFELRILAARVIFIVVFSTMIFAFFPFSFAFEKPEIHTFNILFNMLQADLPYNQLPSLHISFAIVLWASMRKYLTNTFLKISLAIWFYTIALSTLLVYQHHFIDIPTGIIMGFVAVKLISKNKSTYFTTQFTTPRNLKMGLYFLIGSAIFMILSFKATTLSLVFFYLFVSMFSVSVVYAFGLNSLLVGEFARANLWQWLLFFPYFLGSYISWHYFKKDISLLTPVKEKVYLGRFPSKAEYSILREKNINHAINLASEQQIQRGYINQTRLPYLDQTIQSPQALHHGVELIESLKDNGVFVHCTLGLSRSILLISAWLLYNKYTLEEIEKLISEVRPNYVKSAYMGINLEIYKNYLENLQNIGDLDVN